MSMRDKIADILVEADAEYRETGEGPSSNAMADAIMELVQARIDELEGARILNRNAITRKQARIDNLERALTFIACEDNAEGKLARAALKGSDT